MFKFSLFFLIFLTQISTFATRIGFSNEKWLTTNTSHFKIIHSAQHQDLGLYYAQIAETAYAQLIHVFPTAPDKITIILNDSTDLSNGYATVIPYPHIMIYPVQIGLEQTLTESGEWARELVTHELTHIFQMYPYNGAYKYLRPIFGSLVSPNLLTPTWWKEGMAVEMETQFSPRGRTRSEFQNATLRALVNEDLLLKATIAEANETLTTWPYGNRPYFWGSLIMSEMAHEGQVHSLGELTEKQSYRAPYWIEEPSRELYGMSYDAQFRKMLERIQEKTVKSIQTLSQKTFSDLKPIDETLLSSRHPRFNFDQSLLGVLAVTHRGPRLLIYELNSENNQYEKSKKIKGLAGDIHQFEFIPGTNKIVFSKTKSVNNKQIFSDLYIYDLNQSAEKPVQITFSARAREPYPASDGDRIYFIETSAGRTNLKYYQISTQKIESLINSEIQERLTQVIEFKPDQLFYLKRTEEGDNQLYSFNVRSLQSQLIPTSQKQIQYLRKANSKLFFTSLNNGVANIYSAEVQNNQLANIKSESHFLTGSLSFDVFNNQIMTTQHTGRGLHVFASKPYNVTLPQIKNEISQHYDFKKIAPPQTSTQTEDYESGSYLWPQYWFPFISTSSTQKGAFIQASTSGFDPLNIHSYNVSLGYDTYLNDLSYTAQYLNSYWETQFQLNATRTYQIFGTSTYRIQKDSYSLGISPDTFFIDEDFNFSFGPIANLSDDDQRTTQHIGGFAQASYAGFQQKVYQYHPQSGWGAVLRYQNLKAQTNTAANLSDYSQALGQLSVYESRFLPTDHALYFKVDGLYTFENVSTTRFGVSSTSFPMASDAIMPQFHLRGYQEAQFFGSQMVTSSLEYRFPLKNIHRGSGTDPFYIKTLTGAVFVDGLAVKGFGENEFGILIPQSLNDHYYSAGIEARLNTTMGYFLPLKFVLGYYVPFSPAYAKNGQMALSLQLGGF